MFKPLYSFFATTTIPPSLSTLSYISRYISFHSTTTTTLTTNLNNTTHHPPLLVARLVAAAKDDGLINFFLMG